MNHGLSLSQLRMNKRQVLPRPRSPCPEFRVEGCTFLEEQAWRFSASHTVLIPLNTLTLRADALGSRSTPRTLYSDVIISSYCLGCDKPRRPRVLPVPPQYPELCIRDAVVLWGDALRPSQSSGHWARQMRVVRLRASPQNHRVGIGL